MGAMACAELSALLRQYEQATVRLIEVTQELARVARSYDADAWQRAWGRCDEATRRCIELRRQIAEHLRNHCGLETPRSAGA